MNYKKYIENKRVIFVGAWGGLKGFGNIIDSYDIVVKSNGSINFKTDEYYRNYGKRIDVLYVNNQFYRNMKPFPLKEWNLKWLCMKTCSELDYESYSKQTNTRTLNEVMKDVNKECPSAAMGSYIYTDILRCNPKEFFLTGVDFFASKKKVFEYDNYKEYLPGYLPEKIRVEGNKINIGKTEDGHNFLENAKYIYGLYLENENFKMMKETEELLKGIVNGKIQQN